MRHSSSFSETKTNGFKLRPVSGAHTFSIITLLRTWVLLLLRREHESRNPTNDVVPSWSDGQVGFIHSWYKSPTHQVTLRICLSPDGSSSTPWQGWLVRSKVKSRLGCRVQPGNSSTSSDGTSSLLSGSLSFATSRIHFYDQIYTTSSKLLKGKT